MKKALSFLSIGLAYLTLPSLALAQSAGTLNPCQGNTGAFAGLCNLGQDASGSKSVGGVLGSVITVLFVIAAIIALWFLVQGGIRWITSQGDTKNVEGARNQIIAAAVGLAVTFLSYLIINLLLQFFIGHTLQDIHIPTIGS